MRGIQFGGVLLANVAFNLNLLQAQLINFDFNQNNGASWGGGGPNPGPTMSGAAVLGKAGDRWNGINVNTATNLPLIYADGTASPATLTFTSSGGYDALSFGGSSPFASTPYNALMQDYLYTGGTSQSIVVAGLPPNSAFKLVLYNAANSGAGAGNRTTYFIVNGITKSSVWDGASSNLTSGVDYVEFTCALSDASGQLVISYNGNGTVEGDVDGLQIQPAPLYVTTTNLANHPSLSFPTEAGLNYQVEYKTNLTDAHWLSEGEVTAGNDAIQNITTLPNEGGYYRVSVATNPDPTPSILHTSGTNVVNASGAVAHLRGLNLGGWFIMEKWMCPLDSGNLPDTYSAITNLDARFGVATEQRLIHAYQTNWITASDLDNLAEAGYNCVRMPVWWGNFYSITNTTSSGWRADAFDVLDWLVTNCAARGIYVVIDLHGVVGGQSTSGDTGWQNQNQYWTNTTHQSETMFMWQQIATHYKGNPTVAGYDLINEPMGANGTADVWPAYANLYNAIRAVDATHIIIMEGTYGNWDWDMLPDPSTYNWTNVIYSMHEYQYGGTVAQIETGADNQVTDYVNHANWNVPDFVGEWNDMGMGAACYDYSINDYDNAGISWCMWAYKATQGLVPDGWGWYDPVYWPATPDLETDSAATILSDWEQWRTTVSFGVNSSVGL